MANKIASRALMLEREPMSPTRAVPTVDKIVENVRYATLYGFAQIVTEFRYFLCKCRFCTKSLREQSEASIKTADPCGTTR
jgi:hypothetical protein